MKTIPEADIAKISPSCCWMLAIVESVAFGLRAESEPFIIEPVEFPSNT